MNITCTPEELKKLLIYENISIKNNFTKENSSVIPTDKLTDEQLKQVDDYLAKKF